MAATPSIKLTKQFTYRGVTRKWSNRYHFVGGLPPDSSHWTTFASNIAIAEKTCFTNDVSIVEYTGYAAGSEVPVFHSLVSVAGTLAPSTSIPAPGDAAILLRYATAARSAKNHPIYLFNYFHGCRLPATGGDVPYAAQTTAIDAYAGTWIGAGFSDGTTSYNRAGPLGATATGKLVSLLVTHRDFPR